MLLPIAGLGKRILSLGKGTSVEPFVPVTAGQTLEITCNSNTADTVAYGRMWGELVTL